MSPIPAEVSTPSTEASGELSPNTGSAPIGDSQPSAQEIEFPDDASFQTLSPEARRSNWQQLRDQYAETKGKLGESQAAKEQLDARGGFDRLASQAEWGESLFSPLLDPETQEHLYDANDMPQYTAEPFIQRLATDSPSTFGEIMWKGFDMPSPYNPDETIGHTFMRERLGLDPALLPAYQSIKSPQDVARFSQSGSITPEELEAIPAQYHEVYKTFSPAQREELSLVTNTDALNAFLSDKQELFENRKFREEQREFQEAQKQREQEVFQQRVEQEAERLKSSARDATVNAAREKLKTEAQLSPDPAVNEMIWNEIIRTSAEQILQDPLLAKDNATCERLYDLAARYAQQGDRFRAQEAQVQADRLATKLSGRFNNFVAQRTGIWSKAMGGARAVTQQQIQNLQPRAEIGSGGATGNGKQVLSNPTHPNGFGFSPERIAQFQAELEQRRLAG